jgi:hypothetical protein
MRIAHKSLVGKPEGKRPPGRLSVSLGGTIYDAH